jgi:hypothetical protein
MPQQSWSSRPRNVTRKTPDRRNRSERDQRHRRTERKPSDRHLMASGIALMALGTSSTLAHLALPLLVGFGLSGITAIATYAIVYFLVFGFTPRSVQA